jgi:hypothetical protein
MGYVEVSVDLGERSELVPEVASLPIHAYFFPMELATVLGLELVVAIITLEIVAVVNSELIGAKTWLALRLR